jgi:hypothetical protein
MLQIQTHPVGRQRPSEEDEEVSQPQLCFCPIILRCSQDRRNEQNRYEDGDFETVILIGLEYRVEWQLCPLQEGLLQAVQKDGGVTGKTSRRRYPSLSEPFTITMFDQAREIPRLVRRLVNSLLLNIDP